MPSVVLAVFQCWYPLTHSKSSQPGHCKEQLIKLLPKIWSFFSRKQQGAIRTDCKIYSCIFYHLCIMVMIFQVASSLSILQQQYPLWRNTENRWKVIIYNHVKSKKIRSLKDDFLTIFDFTLPFFKALSQDGWIINLNNVRVIFTLYFL